MEAEQKAQQQAEAELLEPQAAVCHPAQGYALNSCHQAGQTEAAMSQAGGRTHFHQ